MKKILTAFVSLAIIVGVAGVAQAGIAPKPGRTTSAPPAFKAHPSARLMSSLQSGYRLSRQQLAALRFKPISGHQLALVKEQASHTTKSQAKTATVGQYYWYTANNAGYSWYDRYYSSWFYTNNNPSTYYRYIFDNWKTCMLTGGGCIDANAWTWFVKYDNYGAWSYSQTFGPMLC